MSIQGWFGAFASRLLPKPQVSQELAESAVEELLQLGYTVEGGVLYAPVQGPAIKQADLAMLTMDCKKRARAVATIAYHDGRVGAEEISIDTREEWRLFKRSVDALAQAVIDWSK